MKTQSTEDAKVHERDLLHQEGEEPPPPGVHTAAIVRWAIIAFAVLVMAGSLLSWAGAFDAVGRVLGGGGTAAVQADVWQCPMHPQIVSDRPGECPICGMDLVKMETTGAAADPHAGHEAVESEVPGLAVVALTGEKLQRSGVTTTTAEAKTLSDPVRTVATISADETRLAKVQTRFSGWIERLRVAETGQKVRKGEVLAEIFSRELYTAQQEYVNASRWAGEGNDAASKDLKEQAARRLELLGIDPREIATLEKTGKPIRALPIRSPVGGYVTWKGVVEGASVEPGTPLFEVADLSRVWAWANVYERDLALVETGAKATLVVSALPGRTFEGKVTFLQPVIDPQTRTLRARIELPNPKLDLLPGMYADARIETKVREGVVIPREALVDTGDLQYVFVKVEDGRFQPRKVRAGPASDRALVILEGVEAGDEVVTSGNFLLDSESRLRAVAQAASAAPNRSDVPIDREKFPEKYEAWITCEQQHRGMGSMEDDCKNAIPKPWK